MKKMISIILVCSLIGCWLVGCNSSADSSKDETTVQQTTVSYTEKETEKTTSAIQFVNQNPYYIADPDTDSTAPIVEQTFYNDSTEFIVTEQYSSDRKMISQDGYSIMGGDRDVETLVLPTEYNGKKIVSIYDYAYASSSDAETTIKNLFMSDTIEYVGLSAFMGAGELEDVTFGKNLKKIDYYAFSDCTSLKEIEFNDTLKILDTSSFQGCTGLVKVVFNSNLNLIGAYSFSDCDSLETLEFAEQYDNLVIGERAFAFNPNLKKVYLPEGTVMIDAEAFLNCENLEEIHIPASVTRFGYNENEEDEEEYGKQYVYIESDILRDTVATIYAPKGSAAEQYAELTGREFVAE